VVVGEAAGIWPQLVSDAFVLGIMIIAWSEEAT